jgi:phage FluMu protein Com
MGTIDIKPIQVHCQYCGQRIFDALGVFYVDAKCPRCKKHLKTTICCDENGLKINYSIQKEEVKNV